ncbi:MAG: phosphopantothenoylcysteine decarboxylase [Pirellulales bacterium]|nr:phosphopantothenoylcysteine decarboxylase [Pirellulales bacterium]
MAKILITSGPTREYLDPVRYLSNASSGRMGAALAAAALNAAHRVTIVSGPVEVDYPERAEVRRVVSTEEMREVSMRIFPDCDGLIAAAAPCDYRPTRIETEKIHKNGGPLRLELVETPDIVASLADGKRDPQWIVAFALETNDPRFRAMEKLRKKRCDLIVVNGPRAVRSVDTQVEILDRSGELLGVFSGNKTDVAKEVFRVVQQRLIS